MADLQPNIYAGVSITLFAALVALILRLKARRMTKINLWYDDYFALVAFVFATGYSSTVLIWAIHYRLGQIIDLTSNDHELILQKSRLLLWTGGLTYASSIASMKVAVLSLYWRIFQYTSIRIPIRILLVATILWFTIRTFLLIFQCFPVQDLWNKGTDEADCHVNQSKFFFGSVLVHCMMDISILILPIIPVSRMHLSLAHKVAVIGIFSSGVVVCVASLFVVVESANYESDSEQMPYEAAMNGLWSVVEVNIAIFSGSLPILKPVLNHILPSCMVPSTHNAAYRLSDSTPNYRRRRRDEEANDAPVANFSGLGNGKPRLQRLEYGRAEPPQALNESDET